jgi:hypothetical protein
MAGSMIMKTSITQVAEVEWAAQFKIYKIFAALASE